MRRGKICNMANGVGVPITCDWIRDITSSWPTNRWCWLSYIDSVLALEWRKEVRSVHSIRKLETRPFFQRMSLPSDFVGLPSVFSHVFLVTRGREQRAGNSTVSKVIIWLKRSSFISTRSAILLLLVSEDNEFAVACWGALNRAYCSLPVKKEDTREKSFEVIVH